MENIFQAASQALPQYTMMLCTTCEKRQYTQPQLHQKSMMADDHMDKWKNFRKKVAANRNINRKRKSAVEGKRLYASQINACQISEICQPALNDDADDA